MAAPSFTAFQHLPAELRLQIWNLALVAKSQGHVLYRYRLGCWEARQRTEAEPDFNPVLTENSVLEFNHKLLGEVEFTIPLFHVSREARSVASAYVTYQNLARRDSVSFVFVRHFEPWRDVLFIPDATTLDDCIAEPINRLFEPDLEGHVVDCPTPDVSQMAITTKSLASLSNIFEEFWSRWDVLETLYVVVNPPEYMRHGGGDHWEIVSAHDAVYLWVSGASSFTWVGEHSPSGLLGDIFAQIERCGTAWAEEFLRHRQKRFEMRVVSMVRRW